MRRDQGRLMSVLEAQTYRTGEAMTLLVQLLGAACAVIVFVVLLLLLSWQLTLLVVVVAIPVSLLVRRVTHQASAVGAALVESYASLAGRLMELLTAMRTIRVFGREAAEGDRIEAASDAARRLSARSESLTQSIQPLAELLYTPVFLAALLYGWMTQMPMTSLLTFLLLSSRVPPHLKRLDYARVSLASYAAGISQVEQILGHADATALRSGTSNSRHCTKGSCSRRSRSAMWRAGRPPSTPSRSPSRGIVWWQSSGDPVRASPRS